VTHIESSDRVLEYNISPERKYTIQIFIVAWSFAVAAINNDIDLKMEESY
jgi:hypothetical protein